MRFVMASGPFHFVSLVCWLSNLCLLFTVCHLVYTGLALDTTSVADWIYSKSIKIRCRNRFDILIALSGCRRTIFTCVLVLLTLCSQIQLSINSYNVGDHWQPKYSENAVVTFFRWLGKMDGELELGNI